MLQSTFGGFLTLVIAVLIAVCGNAFVPGHFAWLITVFAILLFIFQVGLAISGRIDGIVIDNRNRVSLSKLQAALWTVVVLSALIARVGWNLSYECASPVEVGIPNELLAAMGISAVSLVSTPILLSLKTTKNATAADTAAAQTTMAKEDNTTGAQKSAGQVFGRADVLDASWRDVFRGDEVGNFSSPDLSKVQAVLITLTLVGVYIAAIWTTAFPFPPAVLGACSGGELPSLSEHFVWLLGISHAGYLAYKAVPHTKTDDGSPDTSPLDPNSVKSVVVTDPRNQPAG